MYMPLTFPCRNNNNNLFCIRTYTIMLNTLSSKKGLTCSWKWVDQSLGHLCADTGGKDITSLERKCSESDLVFLSSKFPLHFHVETITQNYGTMKHNLSYI